MSFSRTAQDFDAEMRELREAGRRIIVVHISSPGQAQFLYPTYHELRRRHAPLEFYIAQDFPMIPLLRDFGLPEERFLPAEAAASLSFVDVFLQPEIYGRGPASAQRIFFGHGQPNKHTNWSDDNLRAFNIYFLNGDLERAMFEQIRAEKPEVTKHITTKAVGYPKLDDLLSGAFDRAAVLRGLNLDPARKTILYAPAWDPGGSLRTDGTGVVEQLLTELPEVNIIAKLHPVSLEPPESPNFSFYTGGTVWGPQFKALEDNPRFRYIDHYVINPYHAGADVLVTDFSGVALEFMTQDRPVVYLHCPEFYEKTLPGWGSDPELAKNDERFNAGRGAGTVAEERADLKQAITDALDNPERHAEKRRNLMQKFLYNRGRAAEVAADEILGLLRIENRPPFLGPRSGAE